MLQLTEGYGYMPTLIGVCSKHGVILCGDSRMVTFIDDSVANIDDCRKIFKVNDRLIYGVSGMFPVDAKLVDPLVGKNCERLSLNAAMKAVEDYLLEQKAISEIHECSYVLAGEDRGGRPCIVSVRYDEADDTIYTDRQFCMNKDVLWLSLPPAASQNEEYWRKRLTDILSADDGLSTEMKVKTFVAELADVSDFVGGDIRCRTIRFDE